MENSNAAPLSDVVVDGRIGTGSRISLTSPRRLFAGRHLLVDIWNGENLSNIDVIDAALRRGAESGATLLHVHLHEFSENGSISGVAVLAGSHKHPYGPVGLRRR